MLFCSSFTVDTSNAASSSWFSIRGAYCFLDFANSTFIGMQFSNSFFNAQIAFCAPLQNKKQNKYCKTDKNSVEKCMNYTSDSYVMNAKPLNGILFTSTISPNLLHMFSNPAVVSSFGRYFKIILLFMALSMPHPLKFSILICVFF